MVFFIFCATFILCATIIIVIAFSQYPMVIDPGTKLYLNASPEENRIMASSSFPETDSHLVLTLRVPFQQIQDLVHQSIPTRIEGESVVQDTGGLSGIRVHRRLARDSVTLNPSAELSQPKVEISTGVHGIVNVRAFKWIRLDLLLGTLKTKSPEISADVDLKARINGWLTLGIDRDWKFTHQEEFHAEVVRADTNIFGITNIPLKEEMQHAVDGAAPSLIKGALDELANRIAIQNEIQNVWDQLHNSFQLSKNPAVYALLKPNLVHFQGVSFEDPKFLTIRAALDLKCETMLNDKPPVDLKPSPLPPLALERVIDPKSHISVPVILRIEDLNKKIAGISVHIHLDDNSSAIISNPTLYSNGLKLYIKSKIVVENESSDVLFGPRDVFFSLDSHYDAQSKTIRVSDVNFDLSNNKDIEISKQHRLRDKDICKQLEEMLAIDVSTFIEQAKSIANKKLADMSHGSNFNLKAQLDEMSFKGMSLHKGFISLQFDLSGEISCEMMLNVAP